MASETSVTHIGRSTTLRGELSGDGDVQIDGFLEGSVQLTGARITVGPDAKVKAQLSAQDIIVYGRVEGELRATGRADLRASAIVVGDIFAARLSVEDDATVLAHVDSIQAAEKGSHSGEIDTEKAANQGPETGRSTTSQHMPSGPEGANSSSTPEGEPNKADSGGSAVQANSAKVREA